ncbi:MAG: ribosome maturation factor RimP [Rhodospirillaceae bacterium]|nr:MAG: ribosome maturation factor RimP [Rhodospirillaceae bacterium]
MTLERLERPVGPLAKIEADIDAMLAAMGFDLVRLLLIGTEKPRLQLMAEPANGDPMTVEHCEEISRALSALLDVEDPIKDAFTLEVSSAGLDRPLTRLTDFQRFVGFKAKAETRHLVDGRRRFSGIITAVEGDQIVLRSEDGEQAADDAARLTFGDLAKAKLVATDELFELAKTGKLPRPVAALAAAPDNPIDPTTGQDPES